MIIDQICSSIILLLGGFNTKNMNIVSENLVHSQFPKAKLEVISLTPWRWAIASKDLEKCNLSNSVFSKYTNMWEML